MNNTFQRLYGATQFDPNDRQDQIGEAARRTLLASALQASITMAVEDGQDMPYLLGGLMVGMVQILQATSAMGQDETDAAIRASIIQIAPWAVDMARAAQGLEPLATA
jgi:GAF domain-containing protein